MSKYWHHRYLHALASVERAQSAEARAAYQDVAAHCNAMRHFCERHILTRETRAAA